MKTSFVRRYHFFREYGATVVGESAACAFALAKAEQEAEERGFVAKWEPSQYPYELGDAETEYPDEVWDCIVETADGALGAALCSIGDPSRAYCRVVEAQLALEVLSQVREREQADATAHTWQAL